MHQSLESDDKSLERKSIDKKRVETKLKVLNLIEYFVKEQNKRDYEIKKLKKEIAVLRKEVTTYLQYMDDNMGYR